MFKVVASLQKIFVGLVGLTGGAYAAARYGYFDSLLGAPPQQTKVPTALSEFAIKRRDLYAADTSAPHFSFPVSSEMSQVPFIVSAIPAQIMVAGRETFHA